MSVSNHKRARVVGENRPKKMKYIPTCVDCAHLKSSKFSSLIYLPESYNERSLKDVDRRP